MAQQSSLHPTDCSYPCTDIHTYILLLRDAGTYLSMIAGMLISQWSHYCITDKQQILYQDESVRAIIEVKLLEACQWVAECCPINNKIN